MTEKRNHAGRPGRFDNTEDRHAWYKEYQRGYYLMVTKRKRQISRRLRAKERLQREKEE